MIKNQIHCPLVTIITPVFNGIKYLEKCLDSVINQTYPRIEHIIVDGVSQDGSIALVQEYRKRYPDKIKHIIGPDKGAGDAWRKGFLASNGEILGWLGADDLYLPDAVETIVRFFIENSSADFVHTDCDYIDEMGKTLFIHVAEKFDFKGFVETARHVSFPASFYRRNVIEAMGGLDEWGDDYEFIIKVAMQFEIYHCNKITSKFRVHQGGHSNTNNFEVYYQTRKLMFKKSRKYGGSLTSRIAKAYYLPQVVKLLRLEKHFPVISLTLVKVFKHLRFHQ